MRGNCTPVGVESMDYLLVTAGADPGSNQDNQVQVSEQRLVQTEAFPDQTLDPVALDGTAGSLYRHGHAQSRVIQLIGRRQHRYQSVAGLVFAALENPLVLGACEQAVTAGITRRHSGQGIVVRQTGERGPWLDVP